MSFKGVSSISHLFVPFCLLFKSQVFFAKDLRQFKNKRHICSKAQ